MLSKAAEQCTDCLLYTSIENMSYLECPDCGKKISVFGGSKVEEVGKEYGLSLIHI